MTVHVPAWSRSDPGAAPPLPVPEGPPGQVVALVASEGAVSGGWAPEAALDLAQGWSASGVRLVLADAGLSAPSLHRGLGDAPGEGLVDAVRWGASVRRVARRPEGRSFFVITAGTPVADAQAALDGPRWPALCAGFRDAGVTLAVLVPADDPCLGTVLREASAAVVLAPPGDTLPGALLGGRWPVLAVVGLEAPPPQPPPAPAEPEPAPPEPERPFRLRWPVEPEPSMRAELPPEPLPAVEIEPPAEPEAEAESEPDELLEPEPSLPVEAAREPDLLFEPGPFPSAEPIVELEPAGVERPVELEPLAGFAPVEEPEVSTEPEPALEREAPAAMEEAPEVEPGQAVEPEVPAEMEETSDVESEPSMEPEVMYAALEGEPGPDPLTSPVWGAGQDELLGEPVPTFDEIVEEYEAASEAWLARRRWVVAVITLGILGAAATLGAAWRGYLRIPGISPPRGSEEPAAVTPGATLAAPPATETSEATPYSLGIGSFPDEPAARALVQQLAGRVQGVLFTVAPVRVNETVAYRVLAGPAADSASALALAARVAEAAGLDPAGWVARSTPRAFRLGEMPDAQAALRRSEVLQGLGVPSYVLAVTYSDGSVRFRVYAGAYADEAEASYLSGLLEERGLSGATLSDRTGRIPE